MTKTYKKLFTKIIDTANLLQAFCEAAKQKRFNKTVLFFEKDLVKNILNLQKNLLEKTYQHGKYHFFTLYEPKERKISAAPFKDRIVHHAVYQILEPIFARQFIYDSYACLPKKGTHAAVQRLKKFLQSIHTRERERERESDLRFEMRCFQMLSFY